MVMADAPARPPDPRSGPTTSGSNAARFPSGTGSSPASFGAQARDGAASRSARKASSRPPPRDAMPTVPAVDELAPRRGAGLPSSQPPRGRTSSRPPAGSWPPAAAGAGHGAPEHDDREALDALARALEVVPPPRGSMGMAEQNGPPSSQQERTVAMHRGNWTPAPPPMAFGPGAYSPRHDAPHPPNVRTRPPPGAPSPAGAAPPAGALVAFAPPAASIALPHEQAPGVLGLVLFAAPLAFATMAVAALAFL
ncbi:MAG: hypothetical protein KF795_26360 [Labilithrix sp.]|nr:hypothetical protein [Labilithrix sp.]